MKDIWPVRPFSIDPDAGELPWFGDDDEVDDL